MEIKINNKIAEIILQKGKRICHKKVSTSDFVKALVSQSGINTPLLPFGTKFYKTVGNKCYILLEIPATKRKIKYVNSSNKTIFEGSIPLPWGTMYLELNKQELNYNLTSASIYALKKPVISKDEILYHWPLTNVHKSGNICWGNTFMNSFDITSIIQTSRIVDYFFSAAFNTDLHPRINYYNRLEDMLRELENKPTFKYEALVNCNKTVRDLIGG